MKINTVSVVTLGCRVNQYESEAIAREFEDRGYEIARNRKNADVIIVNTCCVTKTSESKSRRTIRHLHTENPDALIVVTGCYGQRAGHELLSIPGVALVTGNGEKDKLAELVDNLNERQIPRLDVEQYYDAPPFSQCQGKGKNHQPGKGLSENSGRMRAVLYLLHRALRSRSGGEPPL